jgi:hypothetical protein
MHPPSRHLFARRCRRRDARFVREPARTATLALDSRPLAMEWPPLGLGFRKMALMLTKGDSAAAAAALRDRSLYHPRVVYRGRKAGARLRPAA